MRLKFKKLTAIAVLACFVWQSIAPGAALAFDEGWQLGGQQISDHPVVINSPPGDTKAKPSPVNNGLCVADPVSVDNGQETYECLDLHIPGRGLDVTITHNYYSGTNFSGQFGFGWMMNYYVRLKVLASGDAAIVRKNRQDVFTLYYGNYFPPAGVYETLVQQTDGTWILTKAHGEQWIFDVNGNLSAIRDRNANQITFTYDAGGRLPVTGLALFSATGQRVVTGLDYRLVKITDTMGRAVDFFYNSDGRVNRITDYAGRSVLFVYDPATDDLMSITRPVSAQFPAGVTKRFTYDATHNLKTITDAKGQVFVTNTYDSNERVSRQDLGAGNFLFDYSTPNRTTVTDRKGSVTAYDFNANGNVLRKEQFTRGVRAGDPASFITSYTYNANMEVASITYPAGNGVKYVYDEGNEDPRARGNVLSVRRKASMAAADNDTSDIVTTFTYDPAFNLVKTATDGNGKITTLTYNTKGDLTKITLPKVGTAFPIYTFTYNAFGQPTKATLPNAQTINYTYNAQGYLATVTKDTAGIAAKTTLTYDTFGNVIKIADPLNHAQQFLYNELGWVIEHTNALSRKTKYTYDANGNVIKVERQANAGATSWQTSILSYDVLNNLKTVQDPLNNIATYNYDANENLSSVVDPLSRTTAYLYDERDKLFKVTDARAGTTQYNYDLNGNVQKIIDAKTNPTTYTYDGFDRMTRTTYANSTFEQYTYDKNSNLTVLRTPSAKTVTHGYDALNRLTARNFPQNTTLNTTYQYDLSSRLTAATNATGQQLFTYDNLDRLTSATQTINAVAYPTMYEYNKAGFRTKATYPAGKVVEYTYDAQDNTKTIKVNGVALANYTYDVLDRRTIRDLVSSTVTQRSTTALNLGDQITSVTNAILTTGPQLSKFSYTYDKVGNRLSMTGPAGLINYAYSPTYELNGTTGAQTHSFTYDLLGNRQAANGVAYTSNNLNQYSAVGGTAYTYDTNGNLAGNGVSAYTYDEANRLSQVVKGGVTSQYKYDPFYRRASKTVGAATTYYIYDGDHIVEERHSSGALVADYTYGPNIDEALTMTRGGQTYYYHHDALGSVRNLTNAAGAIVESYDYDPYGNLATPSAVGNPILFTGRWYDAESGIYDYRRRYYDPKIGRFLSRDPIGYADNLNLYTYTRNNPVNYIDPMGLLTIPGIGWVDVGEGSGQSALDYWASQAAQTNNPFLGGFYNLMGGFAALWTPCTSDKTATTLATGAGIGRYLGRPFYQYYPAGNPGYTSNYFTRGWGWGAPYKPGSQAANKLALPSYNPGTAVRQVKVNPFQYLRGPQRVSPDNGWEGGGTQYQIPN